MDRIAERILQRRMHGLYLSRKCEDIRQLSHELLGLHSWFYRNVAFSALIRGANLMSWKTSLTKTWLYRGTLHGVVHEDLPLLLGLHTGKSFQWLLDEMQLQEVAEKVISLMEDGVYSRAEMRRIFAYDYDRQIIDRIFSPWGGIFVYLASTGKVAFRDMTSRDFDLIDAEPRQRPHEILPELLRQFFAAYGPATLADAAWFFGLWKDKKKELSSLNLDEYVQIEYNGSTYYYVDDDADIGEIPEITLLSGFDPLIVSYTERSTILPAEYKSAVILKSGICNPTIAIHGKVAGLWNIKKGRPEVELFTAQPNRIRDAAYDLVESIRWHTAQIF